MPDPKSFDTLEKAQAEIARLQALIWALAIAAGTKVAPKNVAAGLPQ